MKSKKGLSGIVAVLILIMLVLVVVGIVWAFVKTFVNKELSEAESCFDIFDKITLNSDYTCYKSSNNSFLFSINVEDIDLEKIVVSITTGGSSQKLILENGFSDADLKIYELGNYGDAITIPGKGEGQTYEFSVSSKPDSIEIAPEIKGTLCAVSDSIRDLRECYF